MEVAATPGQEEIIYMSIETQWTSYTSLIYNAINELTCLLCKQGGPASSRWDRQMTPRKNTEKRDEIAYK
jgi:hypothetical protein